MTPSLRPTFAAALTARFDAARNAFLGDLSADGAALARMPLDEALPDSVTPECRARASGYMADVVTFSEKTADRFGIWQSWRVSHRLFESVGRYALGNDMALIQYAAVKKRLVVPESAFLLGAASLATGDQAVTPVMKTEISSDDEFMALLGRDEHPLCVPDGPTEIHFETEPPFITALHDIFHILLLSLLPRDVRTLRLAVCYAFEAASGELTNHSRWTEATRVHLADMDQPQYDQFLRQGVRGLLHFQEGLTWTSGSAGAFVENLERSLRGQPLCDEILAACRGYFGHLLNKAA